MAPFRLALRSKVSGNGEFITNQGTHETFEKSLALHPRTRDVHLGLVRPQEQLTELVGWCDGSLADLDEKRRSTTGGLLMLGGASVAGWSRTPKPTAMSSGESEFYSATVRACELLWAWEF